MIDYLKDVKPLEDKGLDDSQIASHLSDRTAVAIPCGGAKILLEGSQVIVEDPVTQVRSGALIDHYEALPDGDVRSLLQWFISHVMVRGVEIGSHEYPRSVELGIVVASLPVAIQPVASEIIQLGGGQPDAGTTAADVGSIRDAYDAEQANIARQNSILSLQAEIENTWINPAVADGSSTAADVRAAIKAGL